MAKKKKPVPEEELLVPPQDNRICGTICLCQMTAVLSSVAIVYLTVAIYVPTTKAFQSGIVQTPVMCTTTRAVRRDYCDWGSCGEWCLSKTSGSCIQIYVNLRRNGSSLGFTNCSNTGFKRCYGLDHEVATKYRCIQDQCKNLTGTFNCTSGTCINISNAFECVFKETDPPMKCSGRRGKITCKEIEGLFTCNRGTCEKIRTPYNCDRRCNGITTRNKNVILLSGDRVFLSQCQRGVDLESGKEIWSDRQNFTVMASCYAIINGTDSLTAHDCINGSLLANDVLTADMTNFTYLSYLSVYNTRLLDETRRIAPPETDLLIANDSKLLVNLEGCVNTLQDECKEFLREYGKDGTDHNARARFPCYYAEENTELAVARFDLPTIYRHFLIASVLPATLFVVSCLTLILCQRTVVVGDDAKMRFKGCASGDGVERCGSRSLSATNVRADPADAGNDGGGDAI